MLTSLEQQIIRILLDTFRGPGPTALTSRDLTAVLQEAGLVVGHDTVVAVLEALAGRQALRLVPIFSPEREVIVTNITPTLGR